ncbi:MAG: hypothetical protein ACI8UC_001566, partial [Psychromonas sp.]
MRLVLLPNKRSVLFNQVSQCIFIFLVNFILKQLIELENNNA